MRFISFKNKSGVRRIMAADAILMGGMEARDDQVSLFAPKVPALHIPCVDAGLIVTAILNFMAGAAGLPGVIVTGSHLEVMNLNELTDKSA